MIDLKFKHCAAVAFFSFLPALSIQAAALKSAEITAIVNDVKVVSSGQGARPAQLQETISGQSSVQTGLKSRTELLFSDKTMARLGANSMFSFTNGTRDIDLKQGTLLLQVPKGAGGAKITTAAVTAAITGTTIMMEYFPGGYSKVIVLEGTLRLFLTNRVGESILLGPGKMIILNPNSKQLPEPVDVDIKRLVKTSKLIKGIDGTDLDLKLVDKEIANQEKEKQKGDLIGTNLVITGTGTEVIIASEELLNTLQNASFEQQDLLGANSSGSAPGPPAPSKYNPVTTIASPSPYVINNTTSIVTDPTITTNGVTNQGTLYNSTQQGSASAFMFGSTSSFDTATNFDSQLQGTDYSVFRFSNLEIDGSPSINIAGGPNNLFLVSEGNITSAVGTGAFALNFPNLDFLGLGTVNGSISLDSNITALTGPPTVALYARGTAGNIFVDAPITLGANSSINLDAESNVNISSVLSATSIGMRSIGNINLLPSALMKSTDLSLIADGTVDFIAANIDTTGLTTFTIQGSSINFSGNGGFSSANANFTAGTGGFTGTNVSNLFVQSLLSSGDIVISNTPASTVNVAGIIAASGQINVSGDLTAGSIGAFTNVTANKLTSSTNINATSGNITTNLGDIIATNNVTAAGTINSAGSISNGDLLQGATITASGGISAGNMASTSGDITANGGNLVSTLGNIASAGKVTSAYRLLSSGNITAASDITAGNDITATQDLSAVGSITSTSGDILNNGTGNISAGTTISAAGSLGTLGTGSSTTATGTINAGTLVGPSSGTSTFSGSSITAGTIASNSVLLKSATVTINGQATDLSSSVFDSTVQNITINGSVAVNLNLTGSLGVGATPLTQLNADANVTIQGANSIYTDLLNTLGDVTLTGANGNLYTPSGFVGGDLTVNQIKRTTATTHGLTVNGTIIASGTYGIDFQGNAGLDGGNLTLNGNGITFDSLFINGANFVGGDSLTTAAGGAGGLFSVSSATTLDLNSGIHIYAHGGTSSGGNGGKGGTINLAATGTNSILTSLGNVDADGGSGDLNGGDGGNISLSANASGGKVNFNSGSLTASGGSSSLGSGGNGGLVELHAEGLNGQVNTNPYASFAVNGGNSSSGPGGNGGTILMKADGSGGSVSHTSYSTSSANGGNSDGFKGGSGGNINLTGGTVTAGPTTTLSAVGGDALSGSNEGGDGGTFTATSSTGSSISLQGDINLYTGANSGVTYGGDGGTATINGGGPVSISGIIKTSEDTTAGKLSKNGGKITVTSAETDALKPGITIANTGQLLALLNATSVGKGGKIQFTSAGGKIDISGKVDAGKKGQAGVSGTDGVLEIVNNGANGAVNIQNTANLRGDVVKAAAFGTNGVLTINGAGAGGLNADSQIKLYANSNTGTVLFTGGTVNITSPSVIISANTVQVATGTNVNTGAVSAQVYANNRVWNSSQGGTGVTTGTWSTNPTNSGAPTAAPTF